MTLCAFNDCAMANASARAVPVTTWVATTFWVGRWGEQRAPYSVLAMSLSALSSEPAASDVLARFRSSTSLAARLLTGYRRQAYFSSRSSTVVRVRACKSSVWTQSNSAPVDNVSRRAPSFCHESATNSFG